MDLVNEWAARIAQEATPEEVELAPTMAKAFVKGGKDRKQLFRHSTGGELGGFGVTESLVLFPLILRVLVDAASLLYSVLSSQNTANFLTVIKEFIEIRNSFKSEGEKKSPSNPYAPLKELIDKISSELQTLGIPDAECDRITYRILLVLLEEPLGAASFIRELESSNQPPKKSLLSRLFMQIKDFVKNLLIQVGRFFRQFSRFDGGS